MTANDFYADFQNDPTYIELQEMLGYEGVVLGGGETMQELVELCEEHGIILL